MKRVYIALREAKQPLTAADLSAICDLSSRTTARLLRMLRDYGYTIHTRWRNSPKVTDYRLVASPATQ